MYRRGYDVAEQDVNPSGQTPVEFDAWFKSDHVRQSPVYSVHFRPAAPAAPPSPATPPAPVGPPPARPPAAVHGGERNTGSAPAQGAITDDMIASWSQDANTWAGEPGRGKEARKELERRYGRPLGGGKRTPGGRNGFGLRK